MIFITHDRFHNLYARVKYRSFTVNVESISYWISKIVTSTHHYCSALSSCRTSADAGGLSPLLMLSLQCWLDENRDGNFSAWIKRRWARTWLWLDGCLAAWLAVRKPGQECGEAGTHPHVRRRSCYSVKYRSGPVPCCPGAGGPLFASSWLCLWNLATDRSCLSNGNFSRY